MMTADTAATTVTSPVADFYDTLMARLRAELQGLAALRQLHAPDAD